MGEESAPEGGRAHAILSIQLEDDVRVDRERTGQVGPGDPALVERRIARALEALEKLDVSATFFAEGRLVAEIDRGLWPQLAARHELGCQGLSRTSVARLGPDRFAEDARRGREAIEDAAGVQVRSFRAPELAVDGCEPWLGEGLAAAGYRIDASQRLENLPEDAKGGCFALAGSEGAVVELPQPALQLGGQTMTIGSATFRMLPIATVRVLFELAEKQGFVPQLVLQLGDLDPQGPTGLEAEQGLRKRFEHLLRNTGRDGIAAKLQQLGWRWSFGPLGAAVDRAG
ncbi:MAG TPA: polysaccharide deacetylase family protein [Nannocystaceae bacterium]|nr:polysaccharide deacetylase family protein [Nannocystaceae bacterium]